MRDGHSIKRLADAAQGLRQELRVRAADGWSRERLEAHQRERLQCVVQHALARSPFYREHLRGIDPTRPVELSELPPVSKATLMSRFDDWVTDTRLSLALVERHLEALARDDYLLGGYRAMATGGSTGTKGLFVFSRREWSTLLGLTLRLLNGMGVAVRMPRMRLAAIGAPSALHMTYRLSQSVNLGLYRRLQLAATLPVEDLVAALNRHRPDYINVYPSVGALLAEEQLEGRLDISPSIVSTSSEVCTGEMRERMRLAWGLEPYDFYGATDGLWGTSCAEHRGIHFAEDHTLVEVVDSAGRPVQPGSSGAKLLITNLFMLTQPIIRYEITDIVRIDPQPCPCGRPFRLVAAVEGRSDDILRLPGDDGQLVTLHPLVLRSPLARLSGARQYQIVQRPGGLTITLVARPSADAQTVAADARRAIGRALAQAGAGATPVKVELASSLDRDHTAAGKLKLVRSELPP